MILPIDSAPTIAIPTDGCAWWNLACKGGEHAANAGLSAITKSIASGAEMLLGEIVHVVDQSASVPLADPTYRHVYYGFLGLAAPLIGIILAIALIVACLRRDAATLGRAVVGVGIACIGGSLYIVFAQLLVAMDNWLSHGVVRVTGYNLTQSIDKIAVGFHNIAGSQGEMAANMLLIILMLLMLVAGLILWFVLVLRKMAILVVVAFAPLLIAGYLWAPTRSWVRKTTEVLVALVFTKTAIFTLFGIGLALLSRGTAQSLSDFVGTTVLMCGACFAPLMMLRLVHFAADTHLANDAIGTLRGGIQPVTNRLHPHGSQSPMNRHTQAKQQGQAPRPAGPEPAKAGPTSGGAQGGGASSGAASTQGGSAGGGSGGGAAGGGGLVAGSVVAGAAAAGKATMQGADAMSDLGEPATTSRPAQPDPADRPLRGPGQRDTDTTDGKDK